MTVFAIFVAGWKLSLRRLAADAWVVVAVAITVLLSVTALAAEPIYSDAMYVAGARQRLHDAPVSDANIHVSARQGAESDAALNE